MAMVGRHIVYSSCGVAVPLCMVLLATLAECAAPRPEAMVQRDASGEVGVAIVVLDLKDLFIVGTEYSERARFGNTGPGWVVRSSQGMIVNEKTWLFSVHCEDGKVKVTGGLRPLADEGGRKGEMGPCIVENSVVFKCEVGSGGVFVIPPEGTPRLAVQCFVIPNLEPVRQKLSKLLGYSVEWVPLDYHFVVPGKASP